MAPTLAPSPADVLAAIELLRHEITQLRAMLPTQLVDLKAAAEHLGVSERTVKRWVRDDRIPYRRVGRTLRFPLAALNPPS